jgi:hypothetical protein
MRTGSQATKQYLPSTVSRYHNLTINSLKIGAFQIKPLKFLPDMPRLLLAA